MLTPAHFQTVFQNPVRAGSPQVTLLAVPNSLNHPRLGLTIAKKQVKTAVARNRLRRLTREFVRLNQQKLPAADVVIIVKKPAQTLDNDEYRALLEKLWKVLAKRLAKS